MHQFSRWCLKNIALTYSAMGDRENYENTLKTIRDFDPKGAAEVETEVGKGR